MKTEFLKKYGDVFTKKLRKGDVIKCAPVKIETKNDRNIKPVNCCTPIPVQLHLRKAANQELKDFVKAGIVKKYQHWTPWLCRGMFIPKKPDKETEEIKVRLVANFSNFKLQITQLRVVQLILK